MEHLHLKGHKRLLCANGTSPSAKTKMATNILRNESILIYQQDYKG